VPELRSPEHSFSAEISAESLLTSEELTGLNPAATREGPAAQACKSQPGMGREGECKNHCFE
jgi:hypothetical protein